MTPPSVTNGSVTNGIEDARGLTGLAKFGYLR